MDAVKELSYALDTFYFLVSGALVMWMAAEFSMLEAGLVRAKHTAEILTKNIALFSIACVMYLVCGYQIMYGDSASEIIPNFGFLIGADHTAEAVVAGGDDALYYSVLSDFFFQVVFVATAMSIVSGAVAERMKLWVFLLFAVVMTAFIYPVQRILEMGWGISRSARISGFCRVWSRALEWRGGGLDWSPVVGSAIRQVRPER